jgi:hypothetical protein
MKKIYRSILILSLLLILLPTTIFADDSLQEEALTSLSNAELIAYIGNTGSIGMDEAAHPSMLAILLDGNEKNDNSLNGSSNTLLKELEELQGIFNSLDPGEDYGGLEEKSYSNTGFTFSKRLEILKEKLARILTELEDTGFNNEKQKELILSRIGIAKKISSRMRNVVLNTICADFSILTEGASVEGLGTVSLYLDIHTPMGGAVKIVENGTLTAYGSPNLACYVDPATPVPIVDNGGIADGGGFSDMEAVDPESGNPFAHEYTFSFEDVTISSFTLRMLDFGDWNPSTATHHKVEMIAYAESSPVSSQVLEYDTLADNTPNESSSPDYGNLQCNTGDASAESSYPGNWTWNVSGEGITQVTLTFPDGYDPFIGFDSLCFVVEP